MMLSSLSLRAEQVGGKGQMASAAEVEAKAPWGAKRPFAAAARASLEGSGQKPRAGGAEEASKSIPPPEAASSSASAAGAGLGNGMNAMAKAELPPPPLLLGIGAGRREVAEARPVPARARRKKALERCKPQRSARGKAGKRAAVPSKQSK